MGNGSCRLLKEMQQVQAHRYASENELFPLPYSPPKGITLIPPPTLKSGRVKHVDMLGLS